MREQHASKKQIPLLPLAKARANAAHMDWPSYTAATPRFLGKRLFKNFDLAELESYIDWGPFFQTWDLAGPFPAILKDEVVGAEAQRVFSDGKRMLKRLIEGRWLQAHAVVGLYPANSVGDDIVLWTDASRTQEALRWHGLRQQTEKPMHGGVQNPNRCLSDFVAPLHDAHGKATGLQDHVGVFAVTAGVGVDAKEKYFLDDHDDYSAIMLKALADRLAEAMAEYFHQRVRTDLWGYAAQERLSNEALIKEEYEFH